MATVRGMSMFEACTTKHAPAEVTTRYSHCAYVSSVVCGMAPTSCWSVTSGACGDCFCGDDARETLTVTETLTSGAMTCDGGHPCPSGPSLDSCACCSCGSDRPSGPPLLCVYHDALSSPSSALQTETPPLRQHAKKIPLFTAKDCGPTCLNCYKVQFSLHLFS